MDVFASYTSTGCPQDEQGSWMFTEPCEGSDNYHYVENTFSGMGLGHKCYSTLAP